MPRIQLLQTDYTSAVPRYTSVVTEDISVVTEDTSIELVYTSYAHEYTFSGLVYTFQNCNFERTGGNLVTPLNFFNFTPRNIEYHMLGNTKTNV